MADICTQCLILEEQLKVARDQSAHYEHECKALRKEIQRLRMNKDTEPIHRRR